MAVEFVTRNTVPVEEISWEDKNLSISSRPSIWNRALPGLSLMVLAPLLAEVLPGATRFSSIFVLPIEICV
jgi:hypothetical protein